MAKGATVKLADIAPAHVNGLKSAIHAVEVQVTILKGMLGMKGGKVTEDTAADEDDGDSDEDEDEEETTSTKRGKKGKAAESDDDEDEEDDEDEDETEASDSDDDEDEEDDEDDDGPSVADAQKALRAHTKKNDRKSALKILKKVGKVDDVTEIDVKKIPALIKALAA
jgi:cobalamin biosynthesis protein CobT